MIDRTPSSGTEVPLAQGTWHDRPVRTVELDESLAAPAEMQREPARDTFVQWGRCGFVPSSMAHEPAGRA